MTPIHIIKGYSRAWDVDYDLGLRLDIWRLMPGTDGRQLFPGEHSVNECCFTRIPTRKRFLPSLASLFHRYTLDISMVNVFVSEFPTYDSISDSLYPIYQPHA